MKQQYQSSNIRKINLYTKHWENKFQVFTKSAIIFGYNARNLSHCVHHELRNGLLGKLFPLPTFFIGPSTTFLSSMRCFTSLYQPRIIQWREVCFRSYSLSLEVMYHLPPPSPPPPVLPHTRTIPTICLAIKIRGGV